MEHFSHKIFKIKKELTDFTLDLNKYKTKNHRTIVRILDNLSTIQKNSNTHTINNNENENKKKPNKSNSLNNFKKSVCYTKKSISLEKNSLYPFKQLKNNINNISSSINNLNNINNNKRPKRAISSYLNFNNKNMNKIHLKNEIMNDIIFKEKYNNKILINQNKNSHLFSKYENNTKYNKYNTLDDKNLFYKESKNLEDNYKDKNLNKNNIYSYNHNYNFNGKNKNKYKYNLNYNYNYNLYNKTLSNIENEKNDLDINIKSNFNKKDICKTYQNNKSFDPKIEKYKLNTMRHKDISKKNNDNFYINMNNISNNIKTDNLFKKKNFKNNNNNQKINSFREKLLTNNNKNNNYIQIYINDDINDINLNNKKQYINRILNNLQVNNVEEAKIKINYLIKCQKFYKRMEKIYLKYNNIINAKTKNNLNDILIWISSICKYYSNTNYKYFMNEIMKSYNIENFDQLKFFVNKFITN